MKETQKEGTYPNETTDEIPIKLFKGETIINRRHVIMAVSSGKERTRVYFKGVGGKPNYVKDVPYTLLFFVRLLKLKTFLKIQAKYAVNFTSDYIDSVYNDGTTKYLKLNEKDFVGIGGKRDTIDNKLQIKQTYLADINKVFKV